LNVGIASFLAWRFLREGRVQTALVVLGASVGITVVFFLTALVAAVERTMISQTLDVLPHVVVRRPDETARLLVSAEDNSTGFEAMTKPSQRERSIPNWPAAFEELEATPGVVAASPAVVGPALVSRAGASRAVTVLGIDPSRYARVVAIEPRVRGGTIDFQADSAILGTDLALDLGAHVGDRVKISSATRELDMRVTGLVDLGSRDANRRALFVSLKHGQTLLGLPGAASRIDLRVDAIWAAPSIAAHVEARTSLTAESWTESNAQLTAAIEAQRGATIMIRVFVSVAVAIGIASVLVVSVVQRRKQIGILRSMGVTRATILRAFLLQGAAIGLTGGVIGSLLGSLLALSTQRSSVNADGTPMYPIELPLSLYVMALGLATASGIVAAALPARRAAKLDPAEAIRHD